MQLPNTVPWHRLHVPGIAVLTDIFHIQTLMATGVSLRIRSTQLYFQTSESGPGQISATSLAIR